MGLDLNGIHTPTQLELEDIFRTEDEATLSSINSFHEVKRDRLNRNLIIKFKIGFLQNIKDKKRK